jgi:hypothetical protein
MTLIFLYRIIILFAIQKTEVLSGLIRYLLLKQNSKILIMTQEDLGWQILWMPQIFEKTCNMK